MTPSGTSFFLRIGRSPAATAASEGVIEEGRSRMRGRAMPVSDGVGPRPTIPREPLKEELEASRVANARFFTGAVVGVCSRSMVCGVPPAKVVAESDPVVGSSAAALVAGL